MASNQSEVSICNLALSHIGDKTITALTDNTNQARECNRLYAVIRDMELRAHNWNFSLKRTSLAEDGTTPSWEYDHRYVVPSDSLRVVKVESTQDWRIEGGELADSGRVYILTNLAGPIYIQYVARITDPAVFDMLFINAMAARLAMDLAPRLAQSNTVVTEARKAYEYWIGQARALDAIESSPRRRRTGTWAAVRRRGHNTTWYDVET